MAAHTTGPLALIAAPPLFPAQGEDAALGQPLRPAGAHAAGTRARTLLEGGSGENALASWLLSASTAAAAANRRCSGTDTPPPSPPTAYCR